MSETRPSNEQFTLDNLLSTWSNRPLPDLSIFPEKRCSAVAMLFNEYEGQLRLCVGRRAQFPGDPWSGDMAFPGGKGEPVDQTFHDIAAREAQEEIGIDLSGVEPIGALDVLQTFATRTRPPLFVRPILYALPGRPTPFAINNELDGAFWIPVEHIWNPQNADTLAWGTPPRHYPGVRYGTDIIWGFTYRMLYMFSQEMGWQLGG